MADTGIEWATKVWNPVLGCEPISEGCAHCYAQKFHNRLRGQGHPHYQREFGKPYFAPERDWDAPGKWRKPQRVFVCSMADLFYHQHTRWQGWHLVCNAAEEFPQHKFLVLTKRPEWMWTAVKRRGRSPSSNVWLGVTIENQRTAAERLPLLQKCKDAGWHTFVSCEPLLEYVTADMVPGGSFDWLIAGPETGPGKRPCDVRWLMSLQALCSNRSRPFFLKRNADGSPALPWLQQLPDELILPWEKRQEGAE